MGRKCHITYQDIIQLPILLNAWERFLSGKRSRADVIAFQAQLGNNLIDLYYALAAKEYCHEPYVAFTVSDPKTRTIRKATVRDRVVHRLIYDALYPHFHDRFIYDSYSCRKDKGTHRALDRFKLFASQVSKNHTLTCYVLKCDIRKFFASIDHEILLRILERHVVDPELVWLLERIIGSFSNKEVLRQAPSAAYAMAGRQDDTFRGVGLPLGNLTSQLFANVYMHEFDMFVKQELRVKYYIRYTDDFVILSDNKYYLEDLLLQLERFLKERLSLSLHPDKVFIKTYASGVDFLGWIHFPYHRQIRATTRRRVAKRLAWYPKPATANSYRGLLGHGNTYRIKKRLGIGGSIY